MKNLSLCRHNVRVDDDGFVCLTDMWKASGRKKEHKPALFLRNDKVKEFIQSLEVKVQKCTLRILIGGRTPGTWAHKLLAYKYAGWIDPDFERGAYMVLDQFFTGELIRKDQVCFQELHDHVLKIKVSEQLGSFHGKGLRARRADKGHRLFINICSCQYRIKNKSLRKIVVYMSILFYTAFPLGCRLHYVVYKWSIIFHIDTTYNYL